ncbi:rhodanese-like domain-containing protein [Paenibacillus cisolokensis]|uniref:Rhodanese-like domain-containing protein n=1 Tax=Paenibacillus cisolokensis TaxID=1658519 RepID=A0ABQ4N2T1_9BACL|nr:rhodanese-like domain-containing protein [Paenibacillus cisolokensis]GIQ62496.1 rhodanese-like domain-containing protein [Paenibacillus cisolokensis]
MIPKWTTDELQRKLEQGEKINLIDVREQEEWEEGHIAEARHIPLSQLAERYEECKSGEEPIVLICRSGNRSGKACDFCMSWVILSSMWRAACWPGKVL